MWNESNLYSKDIANIVHVGQATHQLSDDSIEPRAKASTGYNASFHFFWLKIHLRVEYLCYTIWKYCIALTNGIGV